MKLSFGGLIPVPMRLIVSPILSLNTVGSAIPTRRRGFVPFFPLLVAGLSDGGWRDFAASEALFLLSSRRVSKDPRISFNRLSFSKRRHRYADLFRCSGILLFPSSFST